MSNVIERPEVKVSQSDKELIRSKVGKDCPDGKIKWFFSRAEKHGFDPFSNQMHLVPRGKAPNRTWTVQVGIDGFRLIAQRTGEADGQDGPYWCGQDGVWVDHWINDEPPAAAKITVFRKGSSRGYTGVAAFKSYSQPGPIWERMPDVMLAKVAEALALRKAFPQELSGLYTQDEMPAGDHIEHHTLQATSPANNSRLTGPATNGDSNKPATEVRGIDAAQFDRLGDLCEQAEYKREHLIKEYGVKSRHQLSYEQAEDLIAQLEDFLAKADAAPVEGEVPA